MAAETSSFLTATGSESRAQNLFKHLCFQPFLLLCLLFWGLFHVPYVLSFPNALLLSIPSDSRLVNPERIAVTSRLSASTSPNFFLTQADSQSISPNDSWSDEDTANFLTGLVLLLVLPLFWGPTRKAVGLVNIIVGTILAITGIGALFGIPMIFIGGICLFI
jgi:hypothetical protein